MKTFNLKIEGENFGVTVESVSGDNAVVSVNGKTFNVTILRDEAARPQSYCDELTTAVTPKKAATSAGATHKVKSPLPGLVLGIKVKEGDFVKEGQVVAVIEAMKMENDIEAERSGIVKAINVEKGDSVLEGATLMNIE